MKKGLKKIIALTMLIGSVASVNSVAFADTPNYKFNFSAGQKLSSNPTDKHDSEQKAYVTITSTQLCCPGPDTIYYRVRTSTGSMATDVRGKAGTGSITLPYSILTGQKGASYKLHGQFDGDAAHPTNRSYGQWNA